MTLKKKKLVVLTGAGMSAESGISTFRDANGLWENYPVEDVASIEGFERDPQKVLDFYNMLRKKYKDCKPNEGHKILADLEKHFDVCIITQNIDNLHEKAGSTNVIHLHGEIAKNRSAKTDRVLYDIDPKHPDLKVGDKAPDGGQLRPFIVWFGEAVPMIEPAIKETEKADIFVVIGSSLVVYPAAGLLSYVHRDTPVYVIDPKPVATSRYDYQLIQEKATAGTKKLKDILFEEENIEE